MAGKRPALALPPPVSNKRPKQNPQTMGRGGGNNKGKDHFSGQSAKRACMHEGTGGAPITGTSFGPITRENSREAINIIGGLGPK